MGVKEVSIFDLFLEDIYIGLNHDTTELIVKNFNKKIKKADRKTHDQVNRLKK